MSCQYVVQNHDIKQVEGKMLALVESLGFSEKQEVAVKSLVRQFLWEPFNDPSTPLIWESEYRETWEFLEKLREARSQGSETTEKLSGKKSK